MTSLLQQLPVWAGATLATWAICWSVVAPEPCQDVPTCSKQLQTYPGYYHIVSTAALVAMAAHEICGLIATYMGSQQTQALIPHLKSRCLPSFLLALMFGVLATAERLFSRADWTIAHVQPNADGLTAPGRPVYTMQAYMEWGINVPILMILSGYCSLGRPLQEVSRPLIVTNVYVIFCWAATATTSGLLKWMLIGVAFAMYGWASLDMLAWVQQFERSAPQDLPSRGIRPWLSNGLSLYLVLYGVVYMSSVMGFIDAHTERKGFFVLTFGSKIAYCAAFVFIRADEYHKTLTDVLRKVSVSNVGMISILRGSFDIILPCVLDAAGRCKLPPQMSGDMEKLEKMLGCRVAGANLRDLLAGEEDKSDFAAYVRNVVRQADCPQGSEVSLSTQGIWTCSGGSMPPIAQVLHSKMLSKPTSARLSATLHLSVVPRSAVSQGKERHLVAAIQFATSMDESKEADAGIAGFESFKVEDVQTSTGGSTQLSDVSGSAIVANLADLTKLGASAILHGSSVRESEEASAYWGPSVISDETMSHLGAFAAEKTPFQAPFDARIAGTWEGTTSEKLGSYDQRIEFHNDCIHVSITLMGQKLEGRFRMNCAVEPHQLDIEVLGSQPVTLPYIFKFDGQGRLHLCGPSDKRAVRPSQFGGSGLCIMERVSKSGTRRGSSRAASKTGSLCFEPDPEFSRNSTAESEKDQVMKVACEVGKATLLDQLMGVRDLEPSGGEGSASHGRIHGIGPDQYHHRLAQVHLSDSREEAEAQRQLSEQEREAPSHRLRITRLRIEPVELTKSHICGVGMWEFQQPSVHNEQLSRYLLDLSWQKDALKAMIEDLQNHEAYTILGVAPEISDSDLNKAYKAAAMRLHPDKGGNAEQFKAARAAYERILQTRQAQSSKEAETEAQEAKEDAKEEVEVKARLLRLLRVRSSSLTGVLSMSFCLSGGRNGGDSWVENLQAPLDALISRLLELNRKQQDELQEVVQLHRHALEALERPVVVHDSLGSYEFPPSEGARGELEVRGDLEDLRPQKPNLPDEEAETCRFQPLSSTFCTKQPSAPDDDDALCRKAESFEPLEQRTNSTARDLSERLEDSRSERVSTWTTSRTPGELATSSAAKDLKLAQERRNGFDTAIGILVLLNAFVMVLDLECQGNQAGLDAGIIGLNVWSGFEPAINVMEHCFAVAFLLELCYRVYSERCKYFKEGMNIFDTVLVAVACIDLYILTPLLATSSFNNTSTLRLLRTVKLVRAVRIVRALRLFRGLRLLIKACSSFLPSLCWSMALLGLFMMMGALFMGNLLQDYILDESLDRDRRTWVWMHYGTAYRAIYTMFEMTFDAGCCTDQLLVWCGSFGIYMYSNYL
ncbi:unnamed protein product [Durusdinium trenchii]|uniref:J domain-containing protein n=1 Tax=Durusdinium trenchii TaxID=1381693 RepID=A0ABP0I153_9DINO